MFYKSQVLWREEGIPKWLRATQRGRSGGLPLSFTICQGLREVRTGSDGETLSPAFQNWGEGGRGAGQGGPDGPALIILLCHRQVSWDWEKVQSFPHSPGGEGTFPCDFGGVSGPKGIAGERKLTQSWGLSRGPLNRVTGPLNSFHNVSFNEPHAIPL